MSLLQQQTCNSKGEVVPAERRFKNCLPAEPAASRMTCINVVMHGGVVEVTDGTNPVALP